MHALSRLLLTLLITVFAARPSFAAEPAPFVQTGRYVGTITVVEKLPEWHLNAIPSFTPHPRDYVSTKAAGRVVATVGRGIRILGTPGTNLLGYLDEPNFASIDMTFANEGDKLVLVSAAARKGPVVVRAKGSRIEITYENFFNKRLDFGYSDEELFGHVSVRIELTRVGP